MRRGLGILLFAALSAAGCSTAKGRIVHSVSIDSEANVDASDAADGLDNHPPLGFVFKDKAEFEPLALEIDRQRVETWFRSRGYYLARVKNYEVVEKEDDKVDIVFKVDAGPVADLLRVDVHNAPSGEMVDADALTAIARLEIGKPLEYEKFREGKTRMEARLANEGYAHATVDATLEFEKKTGRAVAHYVVDSGPLAYFGKVKVEGTGELPPSFVTNRVSWDEGDRFDPVELEQTRARLFQSGLVADVRFDHDTEHPTEVVDIIIRTTTGKKHELRVGAGVGLQAEFYEIRGRVAYTHRSFIDPLLTLRLEARPAYAIFRSGDGISGFNWEASAELEREDFIFPRLLGSLGAEYRSLRLEGYATSGPTGRIAVSRKFLDDRLITSLGVNYEYRTFSEILFALTPEQLAEIGLVDPMSYMFLAPSLTYDGRNDPLAPRSGWWASLRLEGGYVISGATTYFKLTPEVRGYLPLGKRVVVAGRARFGTALNADPIPIPQRFFGGGAESQRGFGRRRLSPSVPSIEGGAQLPVGGQASFETSAEVRVDIVSFYGLMLGAVAFVDAGDVTLGLSDLNLGKLHYAAGPGLRLMTPVGVARLDAGFRLNRMGPTDPDPDSPFAIHFSLGEAF